MSGSYALIGNSAIIRHVQHLVFKIAENPSTVLITGEAGTGKEIIAKMIHDRSPRQGNTFLPVKCANMSEDMLEAELFGLDGAQLASSKRLGSFQQAEAGTVYLDEVNQLSLRLQLSLLKVLHENVFRPVGGQTDLPMQARIVCSTSVDLEQMVRRGTFREDLFYKLSASSIYLPPLRERREDIPILADFFVQKYNQIKNKKITGISHDAMNALLQNNWNNNIQELENLVERIVVLKNAGSIEICDLPPRLRSLVTDNIDAFYDKQVVATTPQPFHQSSAPMTNQSQQNQHANYQPYQSSQNQMAVKQGSPQNLINLPNSHFQRNAANHSGNGNYNANYHQSNASVNLNRMSLLDDLPSDIDQFIKKEIDLGAGIDFYRVVEEFENRLISEALRRTNHNKNRAAQLLSMNRTTLVEKLKKRASHSSVKTEGGKVKRNSSFTIFDGLGSEQSNFEGVDFLSVSGDDL